MPWKGKRFKRLEPYLAPISDTFRSMLDKEREAIRAGETAGLDPDKQYVAVRVGRAKQLPIWVVCESPVDPEQIEGVILFVADVTLGTAIEMVKNGAEVLA